jgi:UDP-2-acetamido-2,6-beta-L-arabino-hexul-4-ose reductase
MKVLVTGANGFIGKNLISFLSEKKEIEIFSFSKDSTEEDLVRYIKNSDFIFHLAGVNRPSDKAEFAAVNAGLTEKILNLIKESNKKIPIIRGFFCFKMEYLR